MIASYVVILFHYIECYRWGLQSVVQMWVFFPIFLRPLCILEAKKVQGLPSQLYIDKGATKKIQYLELISYPAQALHLLMTRSFPSVSCSFAGLTPFTQDALCLPPFTAQNSPYLSRPTQLKPHFQEATQVDPTWDPVIIFMASNR